MSDTRVSLLTPPGSGAIATVLVAGARAWKIARTLFRPAGKPLPADPVLRRFWFGTLGPGAGDEVILAVTGADTVEVHCHGGRRVVRWVIEQFVALGCAESPSPSPEQTPNYLLPFAPTLRTASILLDQAHGAFHQAINHILELLETNPKAALAALRQLAQFADVGRHLVEPWKVVIAGAPNVGKSSLVNALAGFQRTVVSPIAGTTRDVVTVQVAFDGWPVELTDTAGLRDAEGLEAEGIGRARRVLGEADLVVWVMDGTADELVYPDEGANGSRLLVVNKVDMNDGGWMNTVPGLIFVSARTGRGIPDFIAAIVTRFVPQVPLPGAAVPFTPHLATLVEVAEAALIAGRPDEALGVLRACLACEAASG